MRLSLARVALIGVTAALSGCVSVYGPHRIDPAEATERAIVGAAAGTALGTGIGAVFAINPAVGSIIGAETGATLGAVAGIITSQPLPAYQPIAVPTAAVGPDFYDTWPPGSHAPPIASQVPPPPG